MTDRKTYYPCAHCKMVELRKCPCCGEKAEFTEPYQNIYVVQCPNCGMGTAIFSSPEKAVKAWNRRCKDD